MGAACPEHVLVTPQGAFAKDYVGFLGKSSSLSPELAPFRWVDGWQGGKPSASTSRQALRYSYRYPDLIPHHCKFYGDFLPLPLFTYLG